MARSGNGMGGEGFLYSGSSHALSYTFSPYLGLHSPPNGSSSLRLSSDTRGTPRHTRHIRPPHIPRHGIATTLPGEVWKLLVISSMPETPARLTSPAEKGAMYWPACGLIPSESRPGTMRPLDADTRPMMPIIARRPLLISARRAFSFLSLDILPVRRAASLGGSDL
eukprot:5562087-Prymnesium_polylepis.2